MLLISILTLITLRSLPGLNKNLNEMFLKNYGTNKIKIKMSYIFYTRITAVILILTAFISAQFLSLPELNEGFAIYNGLFLVNQINLIIEIFILIVGALILLTWPGIPSHILINKPNQNINNLDNININNKIINLINYYQIFLDKSKDYALIILFNLFGALLLISSFDLISLYISIELQSFALYILATFYKESRIVTAAGLKYFILGALSSCFILLGSGLIYAFSGLTKFDSIYSFISTIDPSINHTQFILGMVLIFLGFLFKVGAAPLHNWSPDVYSGVPTIVTVWLTVIPKLSILILLLELYLQIENLDKNLIIFNSSKILDFLKDLYYIWNSNIESLNNFITNNNIEFADKNTITEINFNNNNIYIIDNFFKLKINWNNFYNNIDNIDMLKYSQLTQIDSDFLHINNNLNNFLNSDLEKVLNLKFGDNKGKVDISTHVLNNLLFISSLLSLIIGTVLGLAQSELKRLLA
jgi:formate hydrogenlyase subunit 3/multisubunit Na+/H+ antiporter MnhD subunit